MENQVQDQQYHKEHGNGDHIKIPKWAWGLLTRLFTVLVLGAGMTLAFAIFWLFVLTGIAVKNSKVLQDVSKSVKTVQKEVAPLKQKLKQQSVLKVLSLIDWVSKHR